MGTRAEVSGRFFDAADYKRDPLDWYIEPGWTVHLLLNAVKVETPVWDPACGSGTIVTVCRDRQMLAFGTDIATREINPFVHDQVDFLDPELDGGWYRYRSIVSNPPYRHAERFVRRALKLVSAPGHVAMLMQAKFLFSERRQALFDELPPSLVLILSSRPSMPPGHLLTTGKIEAAGGKMDFAWIVWDRAKPHGPTEVRWVRRPPRAVKRRGNANEGADHEPGLPGLHERD